MGSALEGARSTQARVFITFPRRDQGERRSRDSLPVDGEAQLLAVPIAVQDVAVLLPEQVDVAGHLDVASTVLLDQVDAPFLPPLQRLQAVRALADPQSRLRQVSQLQAEPELAVNVGEHVEGAEIGRASCRERV